MGESVDARAWPIRQEQNRVLSSRGHSPDAGMEPDSAKELLKKVLSCQFSSDSRTNRKMPEWKSSFEVNQGAPSIQCPNKFDNNWKNINELPFLSTLSFNKLVKTIYSGIDSLIQSRVFPARIQCWLNVESTLEGWVLTGCLVGSRSTLID